MEQKKHLIIVAGEASGDMHAAHLVKAIKEKDPSIYFSGLGGEQMKSVGVKIDEDLTKLAIIGFTEVIKHYKEIKRIFDKILQKCIQTKPNAVILVDYPGFNLRLAQKLKDHNIKVIYYISPQVWAWKKNRVFTIKKCVDKMLVFFQFEKEFYARYGVDVDFIGHPLTDIVKVTESKEQLLFNISFDPKKLTIGILPGSRNKEIENLLPVMLQTAVLLGKKFTNVQFLLLKAPTIEKSLLEKYLKKYRLNISLIDNATYNGIHASDFCMVASGTATLETALLERPMVVVYKTSFLTWILARLFIKIPYIGLVNIVAQKHVVPECIQFDATPKRIAQEIENLIIDKKKTDLIREELRKIRLSLGKNHTTQTAALKVLETIS